MADCTSLKVDDEVLVYRQTGSKQDGEEHPGRVTRVGRTLLDVEYAYRGSRTILRATFRRESGHSNDEYGHYRIETPAQREEAQRRATAAKTVESVGLSVGLRAQAQISLALLEELAAVVRKHADQS